MTANPRFAGRTALVTGGAKRLGRACALALAREGARVVIHYNTSETEARETAGAVEDAGGAAWIVRGDLGDPAAARRVFEESVDRAGPLDFLVNSASIFPESRLQDFSLEELEENVRINAFSPLLLSRALVDQGREGMIINFLDTRIGDYDRKHAAYHLSKRMLFTLTRMMALEYAPAVRVNAIAPGLVLPPPGKDEAYLEGLAHTNPLNTYGGEEDIVEAFLYLAGSRFVTGQVLYIDGGRHMVSHTYGL